jgi:cytoskeletal protein CcmA (bactofilin family)
MALKSFGRGTSEFEVPGAGSGSGASGSAGGPGGLSAFIDQGSEFEGKLSFRDTVRIDGRFRGEIASENTLIVGESGEIHATIRSNTVVVSGLVEGDILAARKVVLHKTARVHGNLETPSLVVEEGADLNGQIKMPGADGKASALKAIPGGARKAAKEPPGSPPAADPGSGATPHG